MDVPGYGTCWRPQVPQEWAPYTEGYWAYTDAGWTWVSQEPFGAVVFHYGRWLASSTGWVWVPGYEWGPAWVSWRQNNDYLGWAPLPPEVPWFPQRGISAWVDVHTGIGPLYYRFCPARDFGSSCLPDVLVPLSRNVLIVQRTQNVTNITLYQGNVFCGGPHFDWVRSHSARSVPVLRMVREENLRRYRSLGGVVGGSLLGYVHEGLLVLPAPSRVRPLDGRYFQSPLSVWTGTLSRGWSDEEARRKEVRIQFQRQWEDAQLASAGSVGVLSEQEAKWIPPAASVFERGGALHADLNKTPLAHPSSLRAATSSQSADPPFPSERTSRAGTVPAGASNGRSVAAVEPPFMANPADSASVQPAPVSTARGNVVLVSPVGSLGGADSNRLGVRASRPGSARIQASVREGTSPGRQAPAASSSGVPPRLTSVPSAPPASPDEDPLQKKSTGPAGSGATLNVRP